jgi:hypothetical protein
METSVDLSRGEIRTIDGIPILAVSLKSTGVSTEDRDFNGRVNKKAVNRVLYHGITPGGAHVMFVGDCRGKSLESFPIDEGLIVTLAKMGDRRPSFESWETPDLTLRRMATQGLIRFQVAVDLLLKEYEGNESALESLDYLVKLAELAKDRLTQ